MDTIPFFEVLAFTGRLFAGNPAGVCILEKEWLPDGLMQRIAAENNLPMTAFVVPQRTHFVLRWMRSTGEANLCGHATLAAAHVLFRHFAYPEQTIVFESKGGEVKAAQDGARIMLDFPAWQGRKMSAPKELAAGLGAEPVTVLGGRDYLAVFEHEKEVAAIRPEFDAMARLDGQGVIVTAPGNDCDFVSRYFAPAAGIPEDPVTGSAHCALIPYWSNRLNKRKLRARQISARGGELFCEDRNDRVGIGGEAVTYVEGRLHVNAKHLAV